MIPARVRPGRILTVAAVAVAALLGGAGVAFAVMSSSSPARGTTSGVGVDAAKPSPSPSRCRAVPPRRGLPLQKRNFAIPGPLAPFGPGPLGAVHGQFVVPKAGGGYQTIDTQRGKVTAVSTSSITVKSADGYTKSYKVTSSTLVDAQRAGINSVKVGQTVSVFATVSGSSATATRIADFTALGKSHLMPRFFKPGSRHVFRIGPCAKSSASG